MPGTGKSGKLRAYCFQLSAEFVSLDRFAVLSRNIKSEFCDVVVVFYKYKSQCLVLYYRSFFVNRFILQIAF